MIVEEVPKAQRGFDAQHKVKYFVVHLKSEDIRPPSDALLKFTKASRTFSFLTPDTADAFTRQVRRQYVENLIPPAGCK
jgi:hypothetical protein